MEILQFLLSNFLGDKANLIKPIIDILQKNNYDISKSIFSLTPETLAPIVSAFTSAMQNTARPTGNVGRAVGTAPIAKIADKEIVYTLNKYLCD